MNQTALTKKGRSVRYKVYRNSDMTRVIRKPKEGDVGYAMICKRRAVLVFDGRFRIWLPPGFLFKELMRQPRLHPAIAA